MRWLLHRSAGWAFSLSIPLSGTRDKGSSANPSTFDPNSSVARPSIRCNTLPFALFRVFSGPSRIRYPCDRSPKLVVVIVVDGRFEVFDFRFESRRVRPAKDAKLREKWGSFFNHEPRRKPCLPRQSVAETGRRLIVRKSSSFSFSRDLRQRFGELPYRCRRGYGFDSNTREGM